MRATFIAPELEEAAELIENGAGKAANKLLKKEVDTPPEGNDRTRWRRFLHTYCEAPTNKRSALPSGIGVETLRRSGVEVINMPMRSSDAREHLRAVIETLQRTHINMRELERVCENPSVAAMHAGHSLITISKQDSFLFADAVAPYSIGTAGRVEVYWIVDQMNCGNYAANAESTYRSGWVTNALVEIISHGAERPVVEGTHLTVRMSIQVTDDGQIIDALPIIADDGYGIQFGLCICS